MERSRWVSKAGHYVGPLLLTAVIATVGSLGIVRAGRAVADVDRVDGLGDVLTPLSEETSDDGSKDDESADDESAEPLLTAAENYGTSNYLIVGSDSRARADQFEPDQHIGDAGDVGGQRSDVIMILRQEENGPASLLSIPRDLWTDIPGHKANRVNAAYNYGPDVLVRTITEELGIPVNHYVEVDFFGFQDIVDAIGGVEMCVENAARDTHTGLQLVAGCQRLDGESALQFARSRHYQESRGTRWVSDPTGDRGRVLRQQEFLRVAVYGVLHTLQDSPFAGNDILNALHDAVTLDDRTNALSAARALRSAASEGLTTFVLPTYDSRVGDAAVLKLGKGSQSVLDYFAGEGPPPLEFATGQMTEEGGIKELDPAAGKSSAGTPSTTEPSRSSSSDS